MLHVARLVLFNWMPFRGTHELELGPIAYGVHARRRGDDESSNWAGKSALLEAVEFCLGGWQDKHRRHGASGWVSEGEKAGGVTLVLSDGTTVVRQREKTTVLAVNGAKGDEAQAVLDRLLGLSREDRMASCFLQQREAARLVRADPSERVAVISSWTRLDRLDDACEVAAGRLDAERVAGMRAAEERRVASELLKEALAGETVEQLRAREMELQAEREDLEAEARGLVERSEYAQRCATARRSIPEYEQLVAEGKKLAEQLRAVDVGARRTAHEIVEEQSKSAYARNLEAAGDAEQKRTLVAGKFDGRCPVANIECPARDAINRSRAMSKQLLVEANKHLDAVTLEYAQVSAVERDLRAKLQEAERLADRVEQMRERARKLKPAYEAALATPEPEDSAALEAEREALQKKRALVVHDLAGVQDRIRRATRAKEQVDAYVESPRLVTLRESASVLSQARRRVSEGAVAEIEAGANQVLRDAGVDLSLSVTWQREGSDPARRCEACGWPFPSSAKVKECGECRAPRGKNQVSKLEVDLSHRSGAAEDLAGIALRLSASAWLRRDRASAWASASLDEPLAQADAANRRVMGAKLWPMLRAAGFAQAFVTSHSPDVLRALPGRIEVESDGKWSVVRVA